MANTLGFSPINKCLLSTFSKYIAQRSPIGPYITRVAVDNVLSEECSERYSCSEHNILVGNLAICKVMPMQGTFESSC